MIWFYRFGGGELIAVNMLLALAVVGQAANIALLYRQFGGSRKTETALETVVLLYLLSLLAAITDVQYHALSGIVRAPALPGIRTALFCLGLLLAAVMVRRERFLWPLLVPAAQALGLPAAERLCGTYFPALFLLGGAFWHLRTGHLIALRRREFSSKLSLSSVKEAMDTLRAGLMFCEPDGRILLQNRRMHSLMEILMGELLQDGQEFFQRLEEGRVVSGSQNRNMGELLAYHLPDGSVWGFTLSELVTGKRRYALIYASDQTERWSTVYRLWELDRELARRNRELTRMLKDMEAICRTEQLIRTRRRVHDVLGQRISLLVRALREGEPPDGELIRSFADGLPQELSMTQEISARQLLDSLKSTFAACGVTVDISGELPGDPSAALAFAEIAGEAVTNAVRHGYASRVCVVFSRTERQWRLTVTNDGAGTPDKMIEGGGLREMRRKARRLGGVVSVTPVRDFRIEVIVPKGAGV